jgi:hemerythrin-like domain-containing protein
MFGMLAQQTGGAFDAQLEALRYQHESGREHVAAIANALDGYDGGQDIKVTVLLENLAAYTSMLRQHIHREDHVFYPLVKRTLSEQDQLLLGSAFEEADQKNDQQSLERGRELVMEMGALLVS